MMPVTHNRLPRSQRTTIIRARVKYATFMALCLLTQAALAQQPPASEPGQKRDDLDVTMQIILDPDAKLPDEVVRRIPLPERKADPSPANPNSSKTDKQDKQSAREAKEASKEAGQSAKDRAKEAAEQREQARRAEAEERKRNQPPHPPHPPNPNRPPH